MDSDKILNTPKRSVFVIKNFGKHTARIERVLSNGSIDLLAVLKPNEEKKINSIRGIRAAPIDGPVDVKFTERQTQVNENPFDIEFDINK